MMPVKDVVEPDMSVDEALKCIISIGVMAPAPHRRVVKPVPPFESRLA